MCFQSKQSCQQCIRERLVGLAWTFVVLQKLYGHQFSVWVLTRFLSWQFFVKLVKAKSRLLVIPTLYNLYIASFQIKVLNQSLPLYLPWLLLYVSRMSLLHSYFPRVVKLPKKCVDKVLRSAFDVDSIFFFSILRASNQSNS